MPGNNLFFSQYGHEEIDAAITRVLAHLSNDDVHVTAEQKSAWTDGKVFLNDKSEFPNIGDPNKLYIALDEGAFYLFDVENTVYRVIGGSINNIDTIQCTLD